MTSSPAASAAIVRWAVAAEAISPNALRLALERFHVAQRVTTISQRQHQVTDDLAGIMPAPGPAPPNRAPQPGGQPDPVGNLGEQAQPRPPGHAYAVRGHLERTRRFGRLPHLQGEPSS